MKRKTEDSSLVQVDANTDNSLGPSQTLNQKLNSSALSWEKKVHLIQELLNDESMVFPHKWSFALDWLMTAMQRSIKRDAENQGELNDVAFMFPESWKVLEQICSHDSSLVPALAKRSIIPVITSVLTSPDCKALDSVAKIVEHLNLARVPMGLELLAACLKAALVYTSKHPNSEERLVHALAKAFCSAARHAGNAKRLFNVTTDTLLIITMNSLGQVRDDELLRVLEEGLFQPETIDLRASVEQFDSVNKIAYQTKMFQLLDQEGSVHVASAIPMLFEKFIQRSRHATSRLYVKSRLAEGSNFQTEFRVFTQLYKTMMNAKAFDAMPELLRIVNESAIYRPANVAYAKEQRQILAEMANVWIDMAKTQPASFNVLKELSLLEFDLLDKNLDKVMDLACESPEFTDLMVCLVKQYSQARTLGRFVEKLVVKVESMNSPLVDLSVLNQISTSVAESLTDQVLDVCQTLKLVKGKVAAILLSLVIVSAKVSLSHRQRFVHLFLELEKQDRKRWEHLLIHYACLQKSAEYGRQAKQANILDLLNDEKLGYLALCITLFEMVDDADLERDGARYIDEFVAELGSDLSFDEFTTHAFQASKKQTEAKVGLLLVNLPRFASSLSKEACRVLIRVILRGSMHNGGKNSLATLCRETLTSAAFQDLPVMRQPMVEELMGIVAELLNGKDVELVQALKETNEVALLNWKPRTKTKLNVHDVLVMMDMALPDGYLQPAQIQVVLAMLIALQRANAEPRDELERVKSRFSRLLKRLYSDLVTSGNIIYKYGVDAFGFKARLSHAWKDAMNGKANETVVADLKELLMNADDELFEMILTSINAIDYASGGELIQMVTEKCQKSFETKSPSLISKAWKWLDKRGKGIAREKMITAVKQLSRMVSRDSMHENACYYIQMLICVQNDSCRALLMQSMLKLPVNPVWRETALELLQASPDACLDVCMHELARKMHDGAISMLELAVRSNGMLSGKRALRKSLKPRICTIFKSLSDAPNGLLMHQKATILAGIVVPVVQDAGLLPTAPETIATLLLLLNGVAHDCDSLVFKDICTSLIFLVRGRTQQVLQCAHLLVPLLLTMLGQLQPIDNFPNKPHSRIECGQAFARVCDAINMSSRQSANLRTSKPFARYVHSIIGLYCQIQSSKNQILDSAMQHSLSLAMFHLLDMCDTDHDREHILALLSLPGKQVFKSMVGTWTQDWKFTG
jgi:hypothetical protein